MIGSEFLKFIDLTKEIKSAQLCRFMDDFFLFDDDEATIRRDFLRIQELLGAKGLNVNPSKTGVGATGSGIDSKISDLQQEIEELVGEADFPIAASSVDGEDVPIILDLTDEQVQKLLTLLTDDRAEEGDIERILSLLRDHADSIVAAISQLFSKFPSVIKQLHWFSGAISDKEALAEELHKLAKSTESLTEYQVFWLAVFCEDYLKGTKRYAETILALYVRSCDYPIARAKILEIPDQWYGLKELRDEYLKTGASHWLSWASAMGTRTLKVAERNYVLDYFSKGSALNFLIASCVKGL
jgi:hypothetical protein